MNEFIIAIGLLFFIEGLFLAILPSRIKNMLEVIKNQWKAYKQNKKDHHVILTAIMRLRQICISPYLVDEDYNEETPKFIWLRVKSLDLPEDSIVR